MDTSAHEHGLELQQPTLQQLNLALYSVYKTQGHPCREGLLLTSLAGCAGYTYHKRLPGKPSTLGMPSSLIVPLSAPSALEVDPISR